MPWVSSTILTEERAASAWPKTACTRGMTCITVSVRRSPAIRMLESRISPMPGDPARTTVTEPWKRPPAAESGMVVNGLTALYRIYPVMADAAVGIFLGCPNPYDPDRTPRIHQNPFTPPFGPYKFSKTPHSHN